MGCTQSADVREQANGKAAPQDLVVVFVLGGPGSGKGTQCKKIKEEFGFAHLSTGDIFRAEAEKDTPRAKELQEIMKSGGLVPVDTTLELLAEAVDNVAKESEGVARVLIDGFPRELDQVTAFDKKFGRNCDFALFFDCSMDCMLQRCLERGKSSGRVDDNEESIKTRLNTFQEKTEPVRKHFEENGLLRLVNADQAIDAVFEEARKFFEELEKADADKNTEEEGAGSDPQSEDAKDDAQPEEQQQQQEETAQGNDAKSEEEPPKQDKAEEGENQAEAAH